VGPCHHGTVRPQGADGERSPICRLAANVLNKKPRTSDKRWSSSMGLGEMLTIPHHKTASCYKQKLVPRTLTDPLVRNKQRKRSTKLGTWNVMSLYKAHSHTAAARELARYKLDLVGV